MPLAAIALLLCFGTRADDAPEKYTFVIAHGATAGGWEWKQCGQFLRDDGHTVYRVTLTGLGARQWSYSIHCQSSADARQPPSGQPVHARPRTKRPGDAPVGSPFRIAATPFTTTSLTPVAKTCGLS